MGASDKGRPSAPASAQIEPKHLFSYKQAAKFLSVSEHTVRRLAESGELVRIYVVPRCPRIFRESLVSVLAKRKVEQGFLPDSQ